MNRSPSIKLAAMARALSGGALTAYVCVPSNVRERRNEQFSARQCLCILAPLFVGANNSGRVQITLTRPYEVFLPNAFSAG